MCDFRDPPHAIINVKGEQEEVPFRGSVGINEDCRPIVYPADSKGKTTRGPTMDDIVDPGFYYICATGGGYSYFDGEKWSGDYDNFVWSEEAECSDWSHQDNKPVIDESDARLKLWCPWYKIEKHDFDNEGHPGQ